MGTPTAYGELDSTPQMGSDCQAVGEVLRLQRTARPVVPGVPYDGYGSAKPSHEIEISEAAARLAAALHLHLD